MGSKRPRALVTGASSGIGAAFAERLAKDGHDLVLVARRRDRLETLAARLGSEAGVEVEVLPADLTSKEDRSRVERAIAADDRLALLVNNAGAGRYQPFLELDPEVAEEIIHLEALTPVRLARAALPGMIARGRGGVINIASLLAFSGSIPPGHGMPHRACYAGGKSIIVTFTQALARELEGKPVRVMVCCPGIVATEFHTVQGMDLSKLQRMSAPDVVQAALAGLALGETVCVPALEDASALERMIDGQKALLGAAQKTELASRYRARK